MGPVGGASNRPVSEALVCVRQQWRAGSRVGVLLGARE